MEPLRQTGAWKCGGYIFRLLSLIFCLEVDLLPLFLVDFVLGGLLKSFSRVVGETVSAATLSPPGQHEGGSVHALPSCSCSLKNTT